MVAQRRGSTTSAMPWCPSKPAQRGERAALDLDHRDAQGGGVQHQLLESGTSLGHHQQAARRPAGGERLLHRAAAGDQLLVLGQPLGRREGIGLGGPPAVVGSARPAAGRTGAGPGGRAATLGRRATLRSRPPGRPRSKPRPADDRAATLGRRGHGRSRHAATLEAGPRSPDGHARSQPAVRDDHARSPALSRAHAHRRGPATIRAGRQGHRVHRETGPSGGHCHVTRRHRADRTLPRDLRPWRSSSPQACGGRWSGRPAIVARRASPAVIEARRLTPAGRIGGSLTGPTGRARWPALRAHAVLRRVAHQPGVASRRHRSSDARCWVCRGSARGGRGGAHDPQASSRTASWRRHRWPSRVSSTSTPARASSWRSASARAQSRPSRAAARSSSRAHHGGGQRPRGPPRPPPARGPGRAARPPPGRHRQSKGSARRPVG